MNDNGICSVCGTPRSECRSAPEAERRRQEVEKWTSIARETLMWLPPKLRKDFGLWVVEDPRRAREYESCHESRRTLLLQYYREFADTMVNL